MVCVARAGLQSALIPLHSAPYLCSWPSHISLPLSLFYFQSKWLVSSGFSTLTPFPPFPFPRVPKTWECIIEGHFQSDSSHPSHGWFWIWRASDSRPRGTNGDAQIGPRATFCLYCVCWACCHRQPARCSVDLRYVSRSCVGFKGLRLNYKESGRLVEDSCKKKKLHSPRCTIKVQITCNSEPLRWKVWFVQKKKKGLWCL